jgi:hypothetical protein
VSGWVQNRKPAAVALMQGELGFACSLCVETTKLTVSPDQTVLF